MVNVAVERDMYAKILVKIPKKGAGFAKILDKLPFALAELSLYTINITIKKKKIKRCAVIWHNTNLILQCIK
ncbi:hypothetical protein CGC58_02665 [Capnocytophaga stomatis]|uniref:Uncharacterized protein n=1 Tax=Capnocytophaga stomatis TaxID=1848904 RepID=A0A250FUP5_9FLAO|nr:hypothetical protein [Capnocytophaga stomatis]ATA88731.1 hypothetical protein CGC58_02665 [Capnocytophaga stomatis]